MVDLIGSRLGQYEIVAFLGKGGMATVYRARQLNIDREVAVKIIKPDLAEASDFIERFKREAKTIASLSHPHILKLFDYGQQGDMIYVVMELLTGGSLADQIRRGALPLARVNHILDQIASALDYAHIHGIIHRDLKPQNVLLDSEGNAHLTDFGIAKLVTETSALTQSGVAMGTPTYMSPEQWRGLPIDARADVYALGILLFEMLTGRAPFSGDTPFSLMHAHVYEPPPPIRDFRVDLPPAVESVIAKALAKDREQRFGSAGELAEAFRQVIVAHPVAPSLGRGLVGEPTQVETPVMALDSQPTNKEPLHRAQRRGCLPLGLGLGAVILVFLVGAYVVLSGKLGQTATSIAIQVTSTLPAALPTVAASAINSAITPIPSITQPAASMVPTGAALSATDVENTIQAMLDLRMTANARSTAEALTASAPQKTPTPTLDIMGTVDARLTATQSAFFQAATGQAQANTTQISRAKTATAASWTVTPTFTYTPKPPTATATPRPTEVQAQGTLEFISTWMGGADQLALDTLVKGFNQRYPGVQVVNLGLLPGGNDPGSILRTRMQAGQPPDTFHTQAGVAMFSEWVVTNQVEPLTDMFKAEGWTDKFPKELIDLLSYKGDIWSVPVNIHRVNVLWFVPDNLKQWNIGVPKTWGEFFQICDRLKSRNIVPLALGPGWTASLLFENVLLAQLGPEDYRALWAGRLKWTDGRVVGAWETLAKILYCTNSDGNTLGDWVPAMQMVLSGKAAFQVMGDWWPAFAIRMENRVPGKDFGWAPAPGTSDMFNLISDTFALPKNARHRDNAIRWLTFLGSIEGQDVFNSVKGSIPARFDCDVANPRFYNVYQQATTADFRQAILKSGLVGSLLGGAVAQGAFTGDFIGIVDTFTRDRRIDAAATAAQQLADRVGSLR